MLILSRKYGERIIVGDSIIITILGEDERGIRVGIDAPNEIPIHRAETNRRIRSESPDGIVRPGGWRNVPVKVTGREGMPNGPRVGGPQASRRTADGEHGSDDSRDPMDRTPGWYASNRPVVGRGGPVGSTDMPDDRAEGAWGGLDWDGEGNEFTQVPTGGRD